MGLASLGLGLLPTYATIGIWAALIALPLFAIAQGALLSLPLMILTDLFPTPIRLTGVALSYNIAFVLFGDLTPIVVIALIEYTQRP